MNVNDTQSPFTGGANPNAMQLTVPPVYPDQEVQDQSIEDIRTNALARDKIPAKLRKFMEMDNIAESLDEMELADIAEAVVSGYEMDKQSREEWDNAMEDAYKLIKPNVEEKNTPWPKAANVKYPLITGACIQFNARTVPEIIKDGKVVQVRVTGPDDAPPPQIPPNLAPNIPQVPPESPPPQQQLQQPQPPQALSPKADRAERLSEHMSYQLLKQQKNWKSDTDKLLMVLPMVGTVYRKSFFNPITKMPETQLCLPEDIMIHNRTDSLANAERITHVMNMNGNDIIEYMRAGLFTEYSLDELRIDREEEEGQQIESEREYRGRHKDEIHQVYEQHRFLDLDEDDYKEPYIVTVHAQSNKVLRIVARYDENSFDYGDDGEMIRINPIQYFTDYHFIPNPDGSFHSLGFGLLLVHLNETVNSLLNQLLDAGVLANRQSGFISRNVRVLKGDYNFRPGEWKLVAGTPGNALSQGIVPLPMKEPSQTLFQLMSFLIEGAKQITAISNVMQGEMPPGNTPVGTTMAVIEQSQKIYSAILERLYDSLQHEFEKLYDINSKYLQEQETFPMAMRQGMVTIEDYKAPDYGIYPIADPKVSSATHRIIQAQALMQVGPNPMLNEYEVMKNYLEALNIPNIDKVLPPPDPNAPPSIEERQKEANLRKTNTEISEIIWNGEDQALNTEIAQGNLEVNDAKQKSQTAFYGGQLAGEKVQSIATLSQLEQEVPPQTIQAATAEEEALTRQTQLQDFPVNVYQRLDAVERQLFQQMQQQQQQSQESIAPEGAPQEEPSAGVTMPGLSPAAGSQVEGEGGMPQGLPPQ